MNKESARPQWNMTTNKDRFCELCNMVLNSNVVAESHYEGKVHSKHLRKLGLLQSDRCGEVNILSSASQNPDKSDQTSAPEGTMEPLQAPTAAALLSSTEVDLRDPNKYSSLCNASFNTPQMALQHYKALKHQRNLARQKLLQQLGDNVEPAYSLMCQMCRIEFNSEQMYRDHMQGHKRRTREKPVVNLCKSQQKVYTTFIDELADYIQVQKARGITPKGSQVLPQGDTQEEDDGEQEVSGKGDMNDNPFPPSSHPPHSPGSHLPASYQEPARLPHGWDYNYPHPDVSGSSHLTAQSVKRRRLRSHSSSSSCTTSSSSSSSSYSSSTIDSGDGEYQRRQKNIRKSRRKRSRRERDGESDKEERGRKCLKRERDHDSKRRRKERSMGSAEERRRKKAKKYGKHRRKEGRFHGENFEVERDQRGMDRWKPGNVMKSRRKTGRHVQDENNVEQEDGRQYVPPKSKNRKKKMKEKDDTRTEEEKLWDDSILGC